MAGFYSDMRQMARDLLAPTTEDGLGQGEVKLTRAVTVDPSDPWGSGTAIQSEHVRAAVRGVDKQLIGQELGGITITAADKTVICEVPQMGYRAGDELQIDGTPAQVIAFEPIPSAGVASAYRFVVRS